MVVRTPPDLSAVKPTMCAGIAAIDPYGNRDIMGNLEAQHVNSLGFLYKFPTE